MLFAVGRIRWRGIGLGRHCAVSSDDHYLSGGRDLRLCGWIIINDSVFTILTDCVQATQTSKLQFPFFLTVKKKS